MGQLFFLFFLAFLRRNRAFLFLFFLFFGLFGLFCFFNLFELLGLFRFFFYRCGLFSALQVAFRLPFFRFFPWLWPLVQPSWPILSLSFRLLLVRVFWLYFSRCESFFRGVAFLAVVVRFAAAFGVVFVVDEVVFFADVRVLGVLVAAFFADVVVVFFFFRGVPTLFFILLLSPPKRSTYEIHEFTEGAAPFLWVCLEATYEQTTTFEIRFDFPTTQT